MTDLAVRPAVPGDRAGWEKLFTAYGEFYRVTVTAETLETVWGWIHDPDHVVEALVAERGGAVVGLAHRAMPSPLRGATLGFLDDLYVDPAARGTGVGEALARLAEIAAERGWRCSAGSPPTTTTARGRSTIRMRCGDGITRQIGIAPAPLTGSAWVESVRTEPPQAPSVMAGLVPAIHEFFCFGGRKNAWMVGLRRPCDGKDGGGFFRIAVLTRLTGRSSTLQIPP